MIKPQWSVVDLETRTLTVRDPKNENDRVVPLSIRAYEILVREVEPESLQDAIAQTFNTKEGR